MAQCLRKLFGGLYQQVLAAREGPRSERESRLVRRLLRLRKGQRVLDIPCGMGRLTIPLARMGLVTTGLDLMPSYIRRAQARARRAGVNARFICDDMRDICFHAEFDAAFNWFTSFGYFSDAEDLAFLRRVLAALRPGGRFLIELVNKSFILAHFRPRLHETVAGVRITVSSRWDARASRMRNVWTFSKGKTTERHRLCLRMFNGTDMRALLRAAGFREVRLYGRPPLGRFTRHSRRLIAVAKKPRR